MSAKQDYACEIMGLIVLTILSALSHFWYIMIAICAAATLAGAVYLISIISLRLRRELLARLLSPTHSQNATRQADISVGISRG